MDWTLLSKSLLKSINLHRMLSSYEAKYLLPTVDHSVTASQSCKMHQSYLRLEQKIKEQLDCMVLKTCVALFS